MNIEESIHRVLNEQYILYHMDHYNLVVPGRTDEYLSPIFTKMNDYMAQDMLNSQVQAIVKSMQAKGGHAAKPLEIMEALEHGALLERILDGIAGALDKNIQAAWSSSEGAAFAQVLQSSHNYDDILDKGRAQAKQVEAFFALVVQGIQAMTGGAVPQQVFTQLTKIGQKIGPKSFTFSGKNYNTATPVTMEQLNVINRVLTYLSNAASKLQLSKTGGLSTESLRATVTQIFSTALGEQIAKQMLEAAMQNLDDEVLDLSEKILGNNSNIQLVSSNFTKSGAKKASDKTVKADLLNSEALNLSVTINGAITNIEIATNISVKWYKGDNGIVSHVSLGSMNMGELLGMFAGAPRGIAYNIIAHNWGDQLGMQKLRSTLAASFVNEWIGGSGGLIQSANTADKVQMLMVNGKLYTVTSIIRKIMNQIPYGQVGEHSPVQVSFQGITKKDNAWETHKKGEPPNSWNAAERRSRRTQGIINGLSVAATLNMNVLGLT